MKDEGLEFATGVYL